METVRLNPDFTWLEHPDVIKKSIEDMKSTGRETVSKGEALEILA